MTSLLNHCHGEKRPDDKYLISVKTQRINSTIVVLMRFIVKN